MESQPIAYLIGAGDCTALHFQRLPGDLVIAADGGLDYLREVGIEPDVILGDFDSLKGARPEGNVLTYPSEKDDTDMFLALRQAVGRGYRRIEIYGGLGGKRLDHTLANLQSLAFLRRHGARGYLYDDNFVYTVIENEHLTVRQTVDWGLLSIFNLGADAEGLTLRGVQYELTDAPLGSAFPLGVSNHIITPQAEIDVRRGLLLVGWELPPLKNL